MRLVRPQLTRRLFSLIELLTEIGSAGQGKNQPSTSAAAAAAVAAAVAAAYRTSTPSSAGTTAHSRTVTAQQTNATATTTTNLEQTSTHLLDPNIVIKSSPAHTPSYSSDIDDNDDESETVLSNTAGAYVANERMSDDEEEILSYNV